MTIDLVPLSRFSEYHMRGWRIVPGYDLKSNDYVATMQSPDHVTMPLSNQSLSRLGKRKEPDHVQS